MKYIISESQYDKVVDKFISRQFKGFEVKKSSEYPDSIFWVKDGEIIVDIEKSKTFWLKQDIWNTISSMFSLKDDEVKSYINKWLEEHLNLVGLTPEMVVWYWGVDGWEKIKF
jgi:hypothetical protein